MGMVIPQAWAPRGFWGTRAFADVFDPRHNALNMIRLLLAGGVIVWHSFPLGGHAVSPGPVPQIMANIFVDGFFAISGYLIVSSWMRDPRWRRFLRARMLRIFPAFWTCLAVTALVIAPLSQSAWGPDNLGYILKNATLWMFQYDIAGTPLGVPFEGAWNGSLWTLAWEFTCYVGVLGLGVLGLLKRAWVIPALFVLAIIGAVVTNPAVVGDLAIDNSYIVDGTRFGLMFLAGALVHQLRHRVLLTAPLALIAAGMIISGSFLPDYRIVAALPIAYLVLVAGALIKHDRMRLKNDISYGVYIYAFPMQQVLATIGAKDFSVITFILLSVAVTVPMALASWFLVEKPAMRWGRRWGGERRPESTANSAIPDSRPRQRPDPAL